MSFQTEIQKAISSKVVLFEIDIGQLNEFWVPYAAGVHVVNFNNVYSKLTTFTTVPVAPDLLLVGSVVVNGIQMRKVSLPDTCIDTDSSFYFESGTRTLYLHCPYGDDPDLFTIRIGAVYGFRKGGEQSAYGGIDFQDRLTDIPSISLNKDATFYGVISFDSMSVKITNDDGEYDLLTRDQNIFGNKARVLLGFEGWDILDFEQIFEGMIGRINTDEEYLTVEFKDSRAALSKAIPENVFSTDDYPDLADEDIGKPIPRVFGTCRNCPVYVYDKDKSTSQFIPSTDIYHVKISDTEYTSQIESVDAIYVNGDLTTSSEIDLSIREFTLKHTTSTATNKYNPGDEVTADLVGELDDEGNVIQNGAKVIRYLLKDYYDARYSNDFYNLSKWDESVARNIGIWIGEQKPLIDVVNDICADGIQGDFYVNGDGKYCLRIWQSNRQSVQTIMRDQIMKTPTIEDDPSKTITSILIGYNKDWANDEYYLLLDNTRESEIFDKYPVYNQIRFDTLTQNSTVAQDYSDDIFDKSNDVETIIKVDVAGWICIEREIGDIVIIYCNRRNSDWYKRARCEIIGIQRNLNDHIVSLTLRFIERIDDVPYTQSYFYVDNYASSLDKIYYTDNDAGTDKRYYAVTINQAL